MPKTYNNLYDKICSLENLYGAYHDARKNKRFKPEVLAAGFRIEEIIHDLYKQLHDMTWQPEPYREFLSTTEVKRRIIHAPTFRDRIVHHAILRIVKLLFEKKFIYDSYAVTVGKGQIRAVKRLQNFIRRASHQGTVYVLQCDISKYYPSVNHSVLFKEMSRTIRDKRVLEIWHRIIESFPEGLPIGAYTSQLSANIYLNMLDHFVKEELGLKYYLRFMDDFIIIHNDKKRLWAIFDQVRDFLTNKLKLRLNARTKLFKATQGTDFAGYRTFSNKILPRKRNVKAARRRFKKFVRRIMHNEATKKELFDRIQSFLGYMKHCDGYRTTQSTLRYAETKS